MFFSQVSQAYNRGQWSFGSHQIFAGMIDKVTTQEDAKADLVGTHHMFPIYGSYVFELGMDSFFVPTLTTSMLVARENPDKSSEESLLLLSLPYAQTHSPFPIALRRAQSSPWSGV
ncbi:MAG: hypothetical protein ACK5P6_07565 [Pseudobdellovibrionaceae bacterium]